jgi:long-chain fatty acid transport protein
MPLLSDLTGINPILAGQTAAFNAKLEDTWFVSAGLEHDINEAFTIRGGVGFEESSGGDNTEVLDYASHSDRIFASIGFSYHMTPQTTFDFAYTHVFIDDSTFSDVTALNPALTLTGNVEADRDIVSFGLRTKLQ